MDSSKIAVRYAKAAYEFAVEKGEETRLYEEMKVLETHFKSFGSLPMVLNDPTVADEDKQKILITAAGIAVSDSYLRLLTLLLQHKRENHARSVALMYQMYYRKQKRIVITKLTTAEPVTPEIKAKIMEVIAGQTSAKVDLVVVDDRSVIGGFVLELEDRRLDASIRSQLTKVRQLLVK
ncbi:MAG: F0F1 ATP synthase subunit delta [Dysgonamonadaceae bacterium]|jgi:F-type H+-transporting ATPase subunit delta|nr:F0F1 ATP synthase subunit delta [Dysgonamonadaceae bacterium]